MLIGEPARSNPTVHVPTWDPLEGPTAVLSPALLRGSASVNSNGDGEYSSFLLREALTALQLYIPPSEFDGTDSVDSFSGDEFRMFEFKVRPCSRGRSHDWTECPYAHPGEKARRRDPRRVRYSGAACPEFRRGGCRKGDACELAHGVFEIWLHPDRYRTQPCKDGNDCRRRVCFFAHTPDQLRILSHQSSPPRSPSVSELVASMQGVHIGETRGVSRYGSTGCSIIRAPSQSGFGRLDLVRDTTFCEEDDPVHRVSSGSLGPDVGWVSELVDTG